MVDPIQAYSSIPIPDRQTVKGGLDPLPPTSKEFESKVSETNSEQKAEKQGDSFETYLEDSSIQNLEENRRGLEYSVVDDLAQDSIYKDPGETKLI